MKVDITLVISWLAWFALVYQVYLQRTHNEKSLKPLGQIDLSDRKEQIYIRLTNNGMGPMIVDRLLFHKDGQTYTTIEECLELDRRSYTRVGINESGQKVILPNGHLVVFATRLEPQKDGAKAQQVREQLSPITLKVSFRDIYDNRTIIERNFHWFSRYADKE